MTSRRSRSETLFLSLATTSTSTTTTASTTTVHTLAGLTTAEACMRASKTHALPLHLGQNCGVFRRRLLEGLQGRSGDERGAEEEDQQRAVRRHEAEIRHQVARP